jgi:hypothetical protein
MSVEGIPETVRRSMKILATHRALFGSRRTTGRTLSELEISRVVSVFESNRAAWALVGAHAVNLLTEPRSTADFDFVVESGNLDAILRDLGEAFGNLQARNLEGVIRLSAIDVDLIPSASHSLFDEALRYAPCCAPAAPAASAAAPATKARPPPAVSLRAPPGRGGAPAR